MMKWVILIVLILAPMHFSYAANMFKEIKSDQNYDLLIQSQHSEKILSLKKVRVQNFEEVAGHTYMVIETSKGLQSNVGYVLLDDVVAILPEYAYVLNTADKN